MPGLAAAVSFAVGLLEPGAFVDIPFKLCQHGNDVERISGNVLDIIQSPNAGSVP